ncbi:MAG TPA: AmmeMemoRadiSam system protein A [Vicinamibacterales bacterium]|jgi:AmmeMemoRadiSam system protein A|nr:AmmeMemoRadiSam system protein A [Vicinamibacterales bacterium]
MTSEHDRRLLLRLAREAIAAHLNRRSQSQSAMSTQSAISNLQSAFLARPGGAFVTLHKRGDLRGCIGHIEPTEPIGVVVPRCAVAACSTDPRFPAITADELDAIDIEISLLGPLEPVGGAQDVSVGRHGLVVERGWQRGLLLPQVATEWRWDAEAFLAHTCEKARLPRDAWQHGAKVWRFEAEVFAEDRSAGRAR